MPSFESPREVGELVPQGLTGAQAGPRQPDRPVGLSVGARECGTTQIFAYGRSSAQLESRYRGGAADTEFPVAMAVCAAILPIMRAYQTRHTRQNHARAMFADAPPKV